MRRKQRWTSHEEEFPNNQPFISLFTLSQFHIFTKILIILHVVFGAILNWCRLLKMLGCKCLSWINVTDFTQPEPKFFSLPEPLPQWPQDKKPLRGFVLVVREAAGGHDLSTYTDHMSALVDPVDYSLPPEGYKALGFVVTKKSKKPKTSEVKCVHSDLTDTCQACPLIACANCSLGEEHDIACLKNLDPSLHAMPNMDQIHAIIEHYGPTVFFHPNELYLPSSVSWFFQNGALLYSRGESVKAIDAEGSVLPSGGSNDGHYWIDLPCDDGREKLKHGNIETFGGTLTDIVMWVFGPFNGPGTLKIGMMSIALSKVGRHVGDWEHFTLRISNFTGELWSIYFSQHSGGEWVDAYDLEFVEGNKAIIYSSRNGHASYPHPGTYIKGNPKLGIGVRNDAASSDYFIDSSRQYEVVAAEYLGDVVKQTCWLQWGPRIVYDSRTELDNTVKRLPPLFRNSMNNILSKLPLELYGEDGLTGPKEKNNWFGDERW
ncbi:hypothetical protein SASPL_102852 [Salvia splendens]|uniref:Vacuolar protein sorting-associated protein 62 n=1 Tax=Salvia splendens TaxID=180675 RepID=A0A8X9AE48_SALSN|nr:hypothetical protein SASPL_102852 [Salvia splendens]